MSRKVTPPRGAALAAALALLIAPPSPNSVAQAPVPPPPKVPAPPDSRFSHDSDRKSVEIAIAYRRVPGNGVSVLVPGAMAPVPLVIRFSSKDGVPPPPLAAVSLQFKYKGKPRIFTVARAPIAAPHDGRYEIPLDAVRRDIITWLANRLGPAFDPYHPPEGFLDFEDVKFTVTPQGGGRVDVLSPITLTFVEEN